MLIFLVFLGYAVHFPNLFKLLKISTKEPTIIDPCNSNPCCSKVNCYLPVPLRLLPNRQAGEKDVKMDCVCLKRQGKN
jgi:hypothetical protein